jgi:hypothetical protein
MRIVCVEENLDAINLDIEYATFYVSVTTRDQLSVTVTVTDFSKLLDTVTARDRDNRESRWSRRTLITRQSQYIIT